MKNRNRTRLYRVHCDIEDSREIADEQCRSRATALCRQERFFPPFLRVSRPGKSPGKTAVVRVTPPPPPSARNNRPTYRLAGGRGRRSSVRRAVVDKVARDLACAVATSGHIRSSSSSRKRFAGTSVRQRYDVTFTTRPTTTTTIIIIVYLRGRRD